MHADKGPGFARGLYGLVDDQLRPDLTLEAKVKTLLGARLGAVQLRLKATREDVAVPLLRQAIAWARLAGTRVIVDDRADWALLAGADGVHLGAGDIPVATARALLPANAIIGATVRTAADIASAHAQGADYVGLGPVFASTTKPGADTPLGIDGFGALARASRLPVIAIAGIGMEHLAALQRAGAYGAAVGAALWHAADITAAAAAMNHAFAAHMK